MEGVARWDASERAELFGETAARLGFGNPLVVEKDFWVCWVLHQLSALTGLPRIVFKGGTSLSKVFGLIRRFSEDIDLAFHRHDLGFEGERDPANPALSGHARRGLLGALTKAAIELVADRLLPDLQARAGTAFGEAGRFLVDPAAADTVVFEYPHSLRPEAYGAGAYVRPQVRLELGARSDHEPQVEGTVRPYAAELFPASFAVAACQVPTLAAERTFWEKATMLHERALRPQAREPERISRHYYDVVVMARTDLGRAAISRTELLEAVARHKDVFFHVGGDVYRTAKPGSLRLVPPTGMLGPLRSDYGKMREMFFEDPPTFDELVGELRRLEAHING